MVLLRRHWPFYLIERIRSFASAIGQTNGCPQEQKVVSDWVLCLSDVHPHSPDLYGRRRRLRVREPLRFAIQCIKADPDHMEHCECFI